MPRSSSSRVLLQMTSALDLSVRSCRLLDDADRNAVAHELGGHGHPDRAGAHDQNWFQLRGPIRSGSSC